MHNSKFKALWDFIFLSGGEMIGKVAGLLAFAYLARALNPGAYGSLEAALALLGIFALFVEFGFGATGTREISRDKSRINDYAKKIPGMKFLLALLCIPTMWAIALLMVNSEQSTDLIYVMSFALLAAVWNQSWLFQGLEKMSLVSVNQALKMLFFLLCVIIFVDSSDDLLWVGAIEVGSAALVAIYFLSWQKKERIPIGINLRISQSRRLIESSSAVGFGNMVWALNQYMPTLLVAFLAGGAATAWLGAAHRIVNAIISFSLVYHFNLFPSVSRRLQQSKQAFAEIVEPSMRVTAWVGVGIALSISLFSEEICNLVFGQEFTSAALPMSVLVWSLPLTLLNGHPRWALIAKEKQRYVLFAQLSGTVTTVVLCFWLIPIFGPLGGAMAMVCCSAMVWLVAHIYAARLVAHIPSLALVWRPVLLSASVIGTILLLEVDSTVNSVLGVASFVLIAPLLDSRLIHDMHALSRIKSDLVTPPVA
jgi:O-antigen/teichoic acid export membrane protein